MKVRVLMTLLGLAGWAAVAGSVLLAPSPWCILPAVIYPGIGYVYWIRTRNGKKYDLLWKATYISLWLLPVTIVTIILLTSRPEADNDRPLHKLLAEYSLQEP